jgi:hypothetical protein
MNLLLFWLCVLLKDFLSFVWSVRYVSSITALKYTLSYIICVFSMWTAFRILILNDLGLRVIGWIRKLYSAYNLVLFFWVSEFVLLLQTIIYFDLMWQIILTIMLLNFVHLLPIACWWILQIIIQVFVVVTIIFLNSFLHKDFIILVYDQCRHKSFLFSQHMSLWFLTVYFFGGIAFRQFS